MYQFDRVMHHPDRLPLLTRRAKAAGPGRASTELGADFCGLHVPCAKIFLVSANDVVRSRRCIFNFSFGLPSYRVVLPFMIYSVHILMVIVSGV